MEWCFLLNLALFGRFFDESSVRFQAIHASVRLILRAWMLKFPFTFSEIRSKSIVINSFLGYQTLGC